MMRIFGFFCLFLLSLMEGICVQSELLEADEKVLNRFFRDLFQIDPFAYTLFGNKPITICDYSNPLYFSGPSLLNSLRMEKGWKVWSRCRHLFPSDRFVLRRVEGKETKTIYLINKTAAFDAITRNLDLFQKSYGENFDPDMFLIKLCDFDTPINQSDIPEHLFGILFGFGRENSLCFEREHMLDSMVKIMDSPPSLTPSPPFESLIEELQDLQARKNRFELSNCNISLEFLMPPGFAVFNDSPELQSDYEKTRKRAHAAYRNGSFLEVTLKQWMHPDED